MPRTIPYAAALILIAFAPAAQAAPPEGFEQRVEALREESGAPGIAIAIVEQGETTLAEGWGVRELGERAPVDAHTIFATGSTGKAFTVAALATAFGSYKFLVIYGQATGHH